MNTKGLECRDFFITLTATLLIELLFAQFGIERLKYIYSPLLSILYETSELKGDIYLMELSIKILHTGMARICQLVFIILYINKAACLDFKAIGLTTLNFKNDLIHGIRISLILGLLLIFPSLIYYAVYKSNLLLIFTDNTLSIYFRNTVFLLLYLLVSSLIAPLAEEVLFRGIIYKVIRQRHGVPFSVILSSLIFAGAHLLHIQIPLIQFIGGLIFSITFEYSKSLTPPIMIHAIANSITVFFTILFQGGA